jgi:hypothetical protein
MASEDRHADSFSKTDTTPTPTPTPAGPQPVKSVDNAEQAARAIAERERTFTTGDDGPEAAPTAPAPATTAHVEATPLPVPPRMK